MMRCCHSSVLEICLNRVGQRVKASAENTEEVEALDGMGWRSRG